MGIRTAKLLGKILLYVSLVITFVIFTFPFFLLIVNSFKSNGQILESPFSLPTHISFAHFPGIFESMHFVNTFKNSLVITVCSVGLIIITSAMCAHYLVRNPNRLNTGIFTGMVASMIIPFQVLMIPMLYIYGQKLGIMLAHPILFLIFLYVGFGSNFAVFMYHGFIKGIPLELEEAALMDGATRTQTFFRIVVPMLSPISSTIAILNTLWIWNDFLLPSLVLKDDKDITLPIAITVFRGFYTSDWARLVPGMLLIIAPLLVVYLFAQRFIIKGVMQGAIK
jgi:raffinose/stachyose/melibiose transport system permease protein